MGDAVFGFSPAGRKKPYISTVLTAVCPSSLGRRPPRGWCSRDAARRSTAPVSSVDARDDTDDGKNETQSQKKSPITRPRTLQTTLETDSHSDRERHTRSVGVKQEKQLNTCRIVRAYTGLCDAAAP